MPWSLPLPSDFDYGYCLSYLNRSPLERLHKVEGEQVHKLLEVAGERVRLVLEVEGDRLVLSSPETTLSAAQKKVVEAFVLDWWDLGRDLQPFYALAQRDDLLAGVVLPHKGLRLIGVPNLFEAICWSIIGQQINLPFAYQMKERLVMRYGAGEGELWLFPEPGQIAGATVADLHALKITRRKCEYLIGMAEAIASGQLTREALLEAGSLEVAAKRLIAYRGIGPWSAHYVLMRCLRYGDAYPVGDAGLQNAVKKRLAMDRKPTEAELWELGADWGDWKAYATFYLWNGA